MGYQSNLGDNDNLEHGLKLSKQYCDHKLLGMGRHTFDSCIFFLLNSCYFEYILVFDMMRMDPQNILYCRHNLMHAHFLDVFCKRHSLHKDWDYKGWWILLLIWNTYELVSNQIIFNNEQKQVYIKSLSLKAKWNIFSFHSQFKDSNFFEWFP